MKRPIHAPSRLALLLLLPVPLLGCAGWAGCASSRAPVEQYQEVPADFVMTFGQGGGFAGLWSGYVIHADGRVERWQGPVTQEDTTEVGVVAPEEVAHLWQEVQAANYFVQQQGETGNMTSFIEVTANGATHRTSWATRVVQSEPSASPLEKLYDYSRAIAQKPLIHKP